MAIAGMLTYSIFDLEKLLAQTYDPDDTIKDIAAAALHEVASHKSYGELKDQQGKRLDTALKSDASRDLEPYGVKVLKFRLTTLAPAKVIRLVQTTSTEGT